jgi:hypothetical protein
MPYTTKQQFIEDLDLCTKTELSDILRSINALPEKVYPFELKVSGSKDELISQMARCKKITPKILDKVAGKLLEEIHGDYDDSQDFVNPNSTKKFLLEWLSEERKENLVLVLENLNKSRKSKISLDGRKDQLLKRLESVPREALFKAIDKMVDEVVGDDD